MELEKEEEVMEEIDVEDEGEQQQQQQNEEEKSQGDNGAKAAQAQEGQPPKIITNPPLALLQSLNDLFDLSGALSEFVHQWHALHHSLDAILSSIDRRSRELDGPTEIEKGGPGDYYPPAVSSKAVDRAAELLSICESTGSRALRKFVVSNLSDLEWLRGEVPAALRRAPSPAKLVLDAMGRFYLQGRKAYDRPMDDPMVVFRRACILILEFYVLSGCSSVDPEESVKKDAQVAALSWRTRLVNEGGVQVSSAVDALGLVLFLSSFGIPEEFGCTDMYNLLRLSNLKKKADVFRKSSILCEKMPGKIELFANKSLSKLPIDFHMTGHKLYFTLMLIYYVNLVGASIIHYLECLDTSLL
ncbi:FRIGIDA-like [Musa troglodytarum]|uniref:FRIGIDA-like protein n=1 Tax=Musa troglodytarum TaxID=320322 RepID=A0A9E7FD33_9LILI|nr:FRIGIDA-like [Musa troglodytarum]